MAYCAVVVAILAASAGGRLADPGFFTRLRLLGFDTMQQLAPRRPDPTFPVRLVDIDDRSFREVEHWPWRRDLMAELVDKLKGLGARVIAFDMVFADPGRNPLDGVPAPLRSSQEFSVLSTELGKIGTPDEQLARSISQGRVVLGVIASAEPKGDVAPSKATYAALGGDPASAAPRFAGLTSNIALIENAAGGLGAMNWMPDQDQILRRIPTLVIAGGNLYPSLAAEAYRLYVGAPTIAVRSTSADRPSISGVRIGRTTIPTDPDGQLWLSFSHSDARRIISAADVMHGRVARTELEGRVVFVGTSAPGLLDLRATPLDPVISGAEINVQAVEQMIAGSFLSRPDFATGLEMLIAIAVSLALAWIVYNAGAASAASFGGLSVVVISAGVLLAFSRYNLLLDAVHPITTATATYLFGTGFLYYVTEQERNRNRERLLLIGKEMESAAQIQRSFLPREEKPQGQGVTFDLFATMQPAKDVGGDFYDYFLLDSRRLAVAIGDVSGKGVPAAIFMSVARTVLRTVAIEGGTAGEVLSRVNDILARDNPEGMFVTLFYAVLDLDTGAIGYSSAGHDDVQLLGADGNLEVIRYMGPAIGLMEEIPYATKTRNLAPLDTLLLITDGITEAFDVAGRAYGTERLEAFLRGRAAGGAQQVVDALMIEVGRFATGAEQSDDITCLALQFLAPLESKQAPAG